MSRRRCPVALLALATLADPTGTEVVGGFVLGLFFYGAGLDFQAARNRAVLAPLPVAFSLVVREQILALMSVGDFESIALAQDLVLTELDKCQPGPSTAEEAGR